MLTSMERAGLAVICVLAHMLVSLCTVLIREIPSVKICAKKFVL